jgi:hypothetical protein
VDPTHNGRSAPGARKSAVFGNAVRSLMLILLTTSHSTWLPVALAQPGPGEPESTTNNQLLPPVAMDSTGNFVVVWASFGSAGTDTGKHNIGVQGPALRHHGDGDSTTQAEPAVAMDGAGNLVVVWLSDGKLRVGYRSIALRSYSADTSSGHEGRVGREMQETPAQPAHVGEFYVLPVPIHPSPSSSWNGGPRRP